jgi:hypothetical protein
MAALILLLSAVCYASVCGCAGYGPHGSGREQWFAANQHANCCQSSASEGEAVMYFGLLSESN